MSEFYGLERESVLRGWRDLLGDTGAVSALPGKHFTVAPQIPVVQSLNGEQLETSFRIIASFNLTF